MLNLLSTSAFAFGMPGLPEMCILAVIALIIFGPKRLPMLARSLGSTITDFKKGLKGINEEIQEAGEDLKKEAKEIEKSIKK